MESSQLWNVPALAIVIALGIVPVYLLVRLWRQRARLTAEERADIAGSPMTRLQKSAWWGLLFGMAAMVIAAALLNRFGVDEYWNNDSFRLVVVGIFIAGLAGCAAFLAAANQGHANQGYCDCAHRLPAFSFDRARAGVVGSPAARNDQPAGCGLRRPDRASR